MSDDVRLTADMPSGKLRASVHVGKWAFFGSITTALLVLQGFCLATNADITAPLYSTHGWTTCSAIQ